MKAQIQGSRSLNVPKILLEGFYLQTPFATRSAILKTVVIEQKPRVPCAINSERSIRSWRALNRGIGKHYLNIPIPIFVEIMTPECHSTSKVQFTYISTQDPALSKIRTVSVHASGIYQAHMTGGLECSLPVRKLTTSPHPQLLISILVHKARVDLHLWRGNNLNINRAIPQPC